MNEQTTALLKQLADKLGVTVEHLWAVLVRQGPISSTCDIIGILIFGAIAWASAHSLIWSMQTFDEDDGLEGRKAAIAIISGLFLIGSTITLIASVCMIDVTIAGFMNPEYWAFRHILNKIK